MDEWLSHRSAKPSTAVRIRFGPQNSNIRETSTFVEVFFVSVGSGAFNISVYTLINIIKVGM